LQTSSLLSTVNTLIRSAPKDPLSYITAALAQVMTSYSSLSPITLCLTLLDSQGKVIWLQNLSASADKGTLSTLWRSITERQVSILEDGLLTLKRESTMASLRALAPLYLLLMRVAMLWQESVSDAILGIPLRPEWEGQSTGKQILNLWQRCLTDCSLSSRIGRSYLQYQQDQPGVQMTQTMTTLSMSSIAPSTTSGLRSLVTFFPTKLQRDTKNLLIARSMSRQSNGNSWFSGHASITIPTRLQVNDSSLSLALACSVSPLSLSLSLSLSLCLCLCLCLSHLFSSG
jgi:hypothetical protein